MFEDLFPLAVEESVGSEEISDAIVKILIRVIAKSLVTTQGTYYFFLLTN